ncbi:patatin-like phospholipase family protein [Flavilitoribacter nigricans]|uniref:PNPLA domain-containing protein n=1 Tax=Flavilitoribacter nigricans (strain ATCC 23147 / DSM 23189 / NBRC 102662 / NCIMB 1420 / SS-2) TaxID=1122177 RepID=A0A2D0N196_FLAN2|nr:patatin-like phospholipase family protein [Flavilitoribacter nigricans]PHN02294.1 hypothetical protein CRP01_32870 [Flavilitoribacter nigricans DSM 23189 = NBRC 102662]
MKQDKTPKAELSVAYFTEHPDVKKEIEDVLLPYLAKKKQENPNFSFSDVRDSAGNCYVDLVQEGGGVLGIALVGFTYALEKAGIRFLKMAGTSAGAINTVMLAAADVPAKPKSEKILEAIAGIDILNFVDGDKDARKFFKALMKGKGKINMAFRGVQVIDNFKKHLGLNPGNVFYQWLADTIESYGIRTVKELRERMESLPDELQEMIYPADKASERENDWPFALVAADITTESKTIMPKHGPLYFSQPEEVHPAYYVRASMAVPLFFHPLYRDPARFQERHPYLGQELPGKHELWESELHYHGETPDKVMFVDGGILSNFPIDIFHNWDKVPRRPTFGVKLGLSRTTYNKVEDMSTFGLIGAAFNSSRNMRDAEYIYNNPELNQLVAQINTGDHDWLNFALTNEEKLDLFYRGVQAGVAFLTGFDWEAYKSGRRRKLMSVVNRLSQDLSLLDKAEARRAKTRTRSRSMSPADLQKAKAVEAAQKALEDRLNTVKAFCEQIDILWIDGDYEESKEKNLPEVRFIESLDVNYRVHCLTEAEAEAQLLRKPQPFDVVISDIKRRNDPTAGIEFLKRMVAELGQGQMPPTIFYISDFDPSRGTPPYAFGITNSPTELMHLIVDVLQRKF